MAADPCVGAGREWSGGRLAQIRLVMRARPPHGRDGSEPAQSPRRPKKVMNMSRHE